MKTVKVNVDYPSCKANRFYSDEFITEIKKALSDSGYELSFNATADVNKGYYGNGVSSFEYSADVSGKEIGDIENIITVIFLRLTAEKAQDKT